MFASAMMLVGALLGVEPQAPEVMLGDPAPALALARFIKGEPIEAFEKDKVYVLEFWATWCEPCRRSMPHLSKLQARFPDATFIGVDVMDEDQDAVKEFVDAMGEQMDFRVAIDAPGEGPAPEGESPPGQMVVTWLDASHQSGLPATFIVDGAGRVAWIGHPLELEKPLAAVVDGSWDLAAESEKFRAKVAATRLEEKLDDKIDAAFAEGDAAGMRVLLEEFIQAFPDKEAKVAVAKLMTSLAADGDAAQAEEYFARLVDDVLHDDWRSLLGVTGFVTAAGSEQTADLPEGLRPQRASEPLLAMALKAANRGLELAAEEGAESEAAARDTLARVYFVRGETAKAVQEQESAIGLTRGTRLDGEPGMLERLGDYRRAEKQGGKRE